MLKKIICVKMILLMIVAMFSFVGCGNYPTILYYNNLKEMQSAAADYNFYYFNLNIEGIEPISFSTPVTPIGKEEYELYGYDISYEIKLPNDNHVSWSIRCLKTMSLDREIELLGTELIGKYFIDEINCLLYPAKEDTANGFYSYGFILFFDIDNIGYKIGFGEGITDIKTEKSMTVDSFLAIVESAIINRYQVTKK